MNITVVFNELGVHLLFLLNLKISNIPKEILRSVIGEYNMALVWYDIITAKG